MKKSIETIMIIGCLFLSGCANPSYMTKVDNFTPTNWSRIVVLPFSGDKRFADEATSLFAMHLLKQNDFIILESSAIQDSIDKVVIKKNEQGGITIADAQRIGQLANVKAVFLGNVNAYNNGATMNGFATVQLIDTESGRIIAASHKPSGLLFGYSEHEGVVAAIERAAQDMLVVLKEMAAKNKK